MPADAAVFDATDGRDLGDLLGELASAFRRRSTHKLFVLLASGMILAGRRTVVAMAAAGIADQFRRACWVFSGAAWDLDALGLAVARLVVAYLVPAGAPVTVAVDGTFFKRWGGAQGPYLELPRRSGL